jgi:iron(III) transport system substrate-binding protein
MRGRCYVAAFAALVSSVSMLPAAAQSKWQDTPQVKQLYEAAKKEGQVVIWSNAVTEVQWIPAAFAKTFPDVEVKFLADSDVGVKAIAEHRAGRYEVDTFMSSMAVTKPLIERNMYAKVDWSIFGTTGDNVAFEGRGGMVHNLVYSVIYNKNLVKPDDLPKSWADLLQPKYKDKMVASSFLLPRLIGSLGLVWREEKMLQFARDMMQTGILTTRSPTETFLQSGERLYAVGNFESQSKFWAAQGLPVGFVIPEPAVAVQFVVGVMDKAPHPNAARLLAGYMTTAEGKGAGTAASLHDDYRRGSSNPDAQKLWAANVPIVFERLEDMPLRDALINKVNPIVAGQAR